MADFETDVIDIPNQVDPNAKPTPATPSGSGDNAITAGDLKLADKSSSYDLTKNGYFFESESFKKGTSSTETFTYKAQTLRMKDGAGRMFNAFKITGYDENGKAFTRIYEVGSGNKNAAGNKTYEVTPYSGATGRATLVFDNSGNLSFTVNNSSGSATTINLALKSKSTVKDNSTETEDKTTQK